MARILYVACGNGLNPNLGGSLVRTIEAAKRLRAYGTEVHVATTPGGYRAAYSAGLQAIWHVVPASLRRNSKERHLLDRAWSYVVSTAGWRFRVGDLPVVDYMYTDSDYLCDVLPAIWYKRRNPSVRWTAMIHHKLGQVPKRQVLANIGRLLQRYCWKAIARSADAVMVYDTEIGDGIGQMLVNDFDIDKARIFSVNNGIDFKMIEQLTPPSEAFDAVMVGGLRPNKGLYDIVPIWQRVVKKMPNARLAIVGTSAYRDWLVKQITAEGLEKQVVLVGGMPHRQALEWMKSARVYISASAEEGWGIAVCEALACGLNVVAYDLPAYCRVFGNGIETVPIGNTAAFAERVLAILSDRNTSNVKGREIAQRYDWNTVAQRDWAILSGAAKV